MRVGLSDLAKSFGTQEEDITGSCRDYFLSHDFSYELLSGPSRDDFILKSLKMINEDTQKVGDYERTKVWEKGWRENLEKFRENKDDLSSLNPKFMKFDEVVRFNQQFILPVDSAFSENYIRLIQFWFFEKYFQPFDNIYEFGCGTGFNVAVVAKLFPATRIFASDFVDSSVNLVDEMSKHHKFNVDSFRFDMKCPDYSVNIENNSCILTSGAIEQLYRDYVPFIEYILQKKPLLCCHIEPITELLDDSNLVDYLAIKFQKGRGYCPEFLPYLRALEASARLNIIKVNRFYFGSYKMEGYNYIIWSPK